MGRIHSSEGSAHHMGYPREPPNAMGADVIPFPGRDFGGYSRRGPSEG